LLYGKQIIWWGRAGKILEFIAALTIIAEIIGPEKMRNFGKSLHAKSTMVKVIARLNYIRMWVRGMFGGPPKGVNEGEWEKEAKKYQESILGGAYYLFAFILFIIGLNVSVSIAGKYVLSGLGLIIVYVTWYLALLLSLLLIFAILIGWVSIGLIIDLLLIAPIAWILDKEYLGKWIKVASIIMLLIGFHFDLLAS
jgi:hypothetical protein